ncbi:unnamed protein product, partial [marine sediment metagenome]
RATMNEKTKKKERAMLLEKTKRYERARRFE